MKLGISYNLFDGEELLETSVEQMRDCGAEYISVVCQTTSNFGYSCNQNLIPLLKRLKKTKKINDVFEYKPVIERGGHYNEITKRQIGLNSSLQNHCTHHMSMDCDEYYVVDQFKKFISNFIEGDYDSSFCQMLSYYKNWEYILDPPEDYYVSLISKINADSKYVFAGPCPVLVDPTRRINNVNKPLILSRQQLQMHHGSYIRQDLKSKLINSSASVNFNKDIDSLVDYYNKWTYPNPVLWGGLPSSYKNVKQTKALF